MKVTSYGLFWRREAIDWRPGTGQRNRFRLLGRIGANKSSVRVADFRTQQGIYILFDQYGPSYIGLTRRESGLGQRLKEHDNDPKKRDWDRFSWFGFKPLVESNHLKGFYGLSAPETELNDDTRTTIGDLEALLIQAMGPKLNKKNMNFADAERWTQVDIENAGIYLDRLSHKKSKAK